MKALGKTALFWGAAGLGGWMVCRLARHLSFDFKDKAVLVTGASRGLGLVMARELTRAGASVGICARSAGELERAGGDLSRFGPRPFTHVCDVTDAAQVGELVRAFEEAQGPTDVLINNAGTIAVGPMSTMQREDFEEALAISFWAAYHTTEAVLPGMKQRRRGRIVNISSIGGKIAIPHLLPYSVGKFALAGYSEGLRAELANNGIVVTSIFPGLMRTGSPPNAFFKGQHRSEYAWFAISDSLPLLTVSAEWAARSILNACRRGDAELIVSLPAKAAVKMHTLFPGIASGLLNFSNRMMPRPAGAGPERYRGEDSESEWAPSTLTALTEEAATRNNERVSSQ